MPGKLIVPERTKRRLKVNYRSTVRRSRASLKRPLPTFVSRRPSVLLTAPEEEGYRTPSHQEVRHIVALARMVQHALGETERGGSTFRPAGDTGFRRRRSPPVLTADNITQYGPERPGVNRAAKNPVRKNSRRNRQ